jgi:hypothetical protein
VRIHFANAPVRERRLYRPHTDSLSPESKSDSRRFPRKSAKIGRRAAESGARRYATSLSPQPPHQNRMDPVLMCNSNGKKCP